jgi:hypothetical protein
LTTKYLKSDSCQALWLLELLADGYKVLSEFLGEIWIIAE